MDPFTWFPYLLHNRIYYRRLNCDNSYRFFFSSFSAYQVIVLRVTDGVVELPNDYNSKLKDWSNANKDNLNFYVAAEIGNNPVHEEPWEFNVGDDKKYGAYENKGLERGENYVVYQRAVTHDKNVSKHGT